MRFLFRPPAAEATGLLSLPWDRPLAEWDPSRLLEVPQRGISRHVVRFVATGGRVFALKEINERLARHEYALLTRFEEEGLPTVSVLGICVDRSEDQEAILVTRYLEYSMSYRWLFSSPRAEHSAEQLLDTMVELLVRLHLAGIFWGDCSLSNTLFRPDAGALAAYLVDAETVERHPSLSPGQRAYDVDLARERVGAELLDLQYGGLLPESIDPVDVAAGLPPRYEALWEEVTAEQVFGVDEQQWRITERLRRLNDLGFDVGEVELITSPEGAKLRVETRVAEPGQHRRELLRLTGLEVQERQARRLLNDIVAFRAHLEQKVGHPVSESFAAHRWLAEVYQPVVAAIPRELAGRLAPAEVFHEVLEHRWFLSEKARRDVGTAEATKSYVAHVLPQTPKEITTPSVRAELRPDA
ncbi:lipopolysaccharide kinase (Kdo/WaaP) family protein [Blastococcus colisei]|uniref:Lipopolysaccharide kinase (Kdo/WaaP) family protein n=2 Tax=Blastococcus colisei TaxID=1564162 RepID=A0A543PH67_9ACTN|nr:lipopolysaccharide kinase (Kdo/WaaP) family protein [Blastococcus colisei]